MRDIMVETGFDSSEADGISGIGAQFKTPEKHEDESRRQMTKAVGDMQAVPVQAKGNKDASKAVPRKVETTTLSFPIKFEDPSGRIQYAILQVNNVPKKTADDLGATTRYVTGLLENPKALKAALDKGDVQITTMVRKTEMPASGETVVPVFGQPTGVYFVNAGTPAKPQMAAVKADLTKHLDYLATMERKPDYLGVVVKK